jgi:hypothetical protein
MHINYEFALKMKGDRMGYLGLILIVIIAIASLVGELPMTGLLFISGFFGLYCLITAFSKGEKLTDIGKVVLILSLFGLAISIPDIFFNIDVVSILIKSK